MTILHIFCMFLISVYMIKVGLLLQGIKNSISKSNDKNDEYTSLRNKGIKTYKIKDASVEFYSGSDNATEDKRNNKGMFIDIYNLYFKQYTFFV